MFVGILVCVHLHLCTLVLCTWRPPYNLMLLMKKLHCLTFSTKSLVTDSKADTDRYLT